MQVLIRSASVIILGALFVLCAAVWSAELGRGGLAAAALADGELLVAMLDVGQGDALYIESPWGVQVLIDGGPGSAVLARLPEVMPLLDRTLDAVIATHPDQDHIGGLAEVLRRYEVGAFLEPGVPKASVAAQALEREVDAQDIPRYLARRGMTLNLGGGAVLEVLYPDYDVSNLPDEKANEGGIVLLLAYGQSTMLLMADVGMGVENYLLGIDAAALDSDILKVGHHGSKYSSAAGFLAAVSPEIAIISVGKNSYGHPTGEALLRLARVGARILRTDESGTIWCRSRGAAFECADAR